MINTNSLNNIKFHIDYSGSKSFLKERECNFNFLIKQIKEYNKLNNFLLENNIELDYQFKNINDYFIDDYFVNLADFTFSFLTFDYSKVNNDIKETILNFVKKNIDNILYVIRFDLHKASNLVYSGGNLSFILNAILSNKTIIDINDVNKTFLNKIFKFIKYFEVDDSQIIKNNFTEIIDYNSCSIIFRKMSHRKYIELGSIEYFLDKVYVNEKMYSVIINRVEKILNNNENLINNFHLKFIENIVYSLFDNHNNISQDFLVNYYSNHPKYKNEYINNLSLKIINPENSIYLENKVKYYNNDKLFLFKHIVDLDIFKDKDELKSVLINNLNGIKYYDKQMIKNKVTEFNLDLKKYTNIENTTDYFLFLSFICTFGKILPENNIFFKFSITNTNYLSNINDISLSRINAYTDKYSSFFGNQINIMRNRNHSINYNDIKNEISNDKENNIFSNNFVYLKEIKFTFLINVLYNRENFILDDKEFVNFIDKLFDKFSYNKFDFINDFNFLHNNTILNNNKELINEMDKIKTIINNCFFYKTNTVKKSKIHL